MGTVYEDDRVGLRTFPECDDPDDRLGLVKEVELVRAARLIIMAALYSDHLSADCWPTIELAKWVIENIWTPDLEPVN